MLLVFAQRQRALNVNLILLFVSCAAGAGWVLALLEEITLGTLVGAAFGVAVGAFALLYIRWIGVAGGFLFRRTIYGKKELAQEKVELGISLYRGSKGGPTYTVYAFDGVTEMDLTESSSLSRAERLRERLRELFLFPLGERRQARSVAEMIAAREARWRSPQLPSNEKSTRAPLITVMLITFILAVGVAIALNLKR